MFLAAGTVSFAQYVVKGYVLDAESRPLTGAAVTVLENSRLGATAGLDGSFELEFPDNKIYTLEASFIGYKYTRHKVSGGQEPVSLILEQDAMLLDQIVVTGTRTPKLLKDVPVVTRVITSDIIKNADAANVGDLLQAELPGIEFTYSMNQQTSLNMSGFGGHSVLFLVDGERLAGETLDNVDYCRLNLDNVERIEIVRGAASSLYGSNAVGGVVNIISRSSEEPWRVDLNCRYGAFNEYRYGGSVGFRAGKVSSTTNVQFNGVDDINLAAYAADSEVGDYKTIYGNRICNIKERIIYDPLKNLKFTGRAGYFFRERNSSPGAKERYRSLSSGLKGNWTISGKDDLELSYSFDQYDKSDYMLSASKDIRDYSNVQNAVRVVYNHTFAGRHILTAGGDYMNDYLMSYQFEGNGHHSQHSVDAFAQFDWNPLKKLNLTAGARFDWFSAAGMCHISPKLGVMYKLEDCSLRASYSGGFRAPTLKEMYMVFDMANIFMIYGNPDLKPEKSHNFSLSAEYMKNWFNFTVTGFSNLVSDRITTAWNKDLGGQVYTNMAKLWIAGADVNTSIRLSSGFSAKISYVYTYEHIDKGQPLLSSTRPHTATASVSYARKWKYYGFRLSLSGRFLSKVTVDEYTSSTSYEETEKRTYPGYTLWKFNVLQQIWRGINLSVTVDNIFNYRPPYYYNNSPVTVGTTLSAGLSLSLSEMIKNK